MASEKEGKKEVTNSGRRPPRISASNVTLLYFKCSFLYLEDICRNPSIWVARICHEQWECKRQLQKFKVGPEQNTKQKSFMYCGIWPWIE